MMIGVGGSGKRSLVRLSIILVNNELYEPSPETFTTELQKAFKIAGINNEPVSFLVTDNILGN